MTREEQWLLNEKYGGEETAAFTTDAARLARGEPLAYVIGWQPFLGLKMYMDSRPLIPRPETEWWTEQLLETISEHPTPAQRKFLDLCAGSGAIGCAALARLPTHDIYFGDIEPTHKETIEKNIRENALDASRADVRIGDLFTPFIGMRFDCIAINPPYIPEERVLEESVGNWEPAIALRADVDGLSVIRRIAENLSSYLTPGGVAWIECDSAHAAAAQDLFETQGFRTALRIDQYNKPRVIVVSFP